MRVSILPKGALGWWSIGLAVASVAFMELAEGILGPGPDYNMTLAVILTIVCAAIAGTAFTTGLISIIKRKQGAILVFISTAIGLLFLIGGVTSVVGAMMGLPL